mmetsp:Transcript_79950/g.158929  ORF Transcript_79950/g.158929 Transcript_79950/m.158929 type:complete len:632 (-) Transcript_79950:342-2237(-)
MLRLRSRSTPHPVLNRSGNDVNEDNAVDSQATVESSASRRRHIFSLGKSFVEIPKALSRRVSRPVLRSESSSGESLSDTTRGRARANSDQSARPHANVESGRVISALPDEVRDTALKRLKQVICGSAKQFVALDKLSCVTCLENTASCMPDSCGHVAYCDRCLDSRLRGHHCTICNAPVAEVVQVCTTPKSTWLPLTPFRSLSPGARLRWTPKALYAPACHPATEGFSARTDSTDSVAAEGRAQALSHRVSFTEQPTRPSLPYNTATTRIDEAHKAIWSLWVQLTAEQQDEVNVIFSKKVDELICSYQEHLMSVTYAHNPDPQLPWLDDPACSAELAGASLLVRAPTQDMLVLDYIRWKLTVLDVMSEKTPITQASGPAQKRMAAFKQMLRMKETKDYIHWVIVKEHERVRQLMLREANAIQERPVDEEMSEVVGDGLGIHISISLSEEDSDRVDISTPPPLKDPDRRFATVLAGAVLCKGTRAPARITMLPEFTAVCQPLLDRYGVARFMAVLKATNAGTMWNRLGLPSDADHSGDKAIVDSLRDCVLVRLSAARGNWSHVLQSLVEPGSPLTRKPAAAQSPEVAPSTSESTSQAPSPPPQWPQSAAQAGGEESLDSQPSFTERMSAANL